MIDFENFEADTYKNILLGQEVRAGRLTKSWSNESVREKDDGTHYVRTRASRSLPRLQPEEEK